MLDARLLADPQLSLRWLQRASLLGSILGLASPPILTLGACSTIKYRLDAALPVANGSSAIAQGIQSKSPLVAFTSMKLLILMLTRLQQTIDSIEACSELWQHHEAAALQYIDELVNGAKRRIPQLEVILALRHKVFRAAEGDQASDATQLLVLRVLVLYSRLFPSTLASAKFDVSKAVLSAAAFGKLQVNVQLELVDLLAAHAVDFKWHSKSKDHGGVSHMHTLLQAYAECPSEPVRQRLLGLLTALMSGTELFSSALEPSAWVRPLVAFPGAVPFTVTLLCELAQDPYKALNSSLQELAAASGDTDSGSPADSAGATIRVSPLLMLALGSFDKLTGDAGAGDAPNDVVVTVTAYICAVLADVFHLFPNKAVISKLLLARLPVEPVAAAAAGVINRVRAHIQSWAGPVLVGKGGPSPQPTNMEEGWAAASSAPGVAKAASAVLQLPHVGYEHFITALGRNVHSNIVPAISLVFSPPWASNSAESSAAPNPSLFEMVGVRETFSSARVNGGKRRQQTRHAVRQLIDLIPVGLLLRNCNSEDLLVCPVVQGIVMYRFEHAQSSELEVATVILLQLLHQLGGSPANGKLQDSPSAANRQAVRFCASLLIRACEANAGQIDPVVMTSALSSKTVRGLLEASSSLTSESKATHHTVLRLMRLAASIDGNRGVIDTFLRGQFDVFAAFCSDLQASPTAVLTDEARRTIDHVHTFHELLPVALVRDLVQRAIVAFPEALFAPFVNRRRDPSMRCAIVEVLLKLLVLKAYRPVPAEAQHRIASMALRYETSRPLAETLSALMGQSSGSAPGVGGDHDMSSSFPAAVDAETFRQWMRGSSASHHLLVSFLTRRSTFHRVLFEADWGRSTKSAATIDQGHLSAALPYMHGIMVPVDDPSSTWASFALPYQLDELLVSPFTSRCCHNLCRQMLSSSLASEDGDAALAGEGSLLLLQRLLCSQQRGAVEQGLLSATLNRLIGGDTLKTRAKLHAAIAVVACMAPEDQGSAGGRLLVATLEAIVALEGSDDADGSASLDGMLVRCYRSAAVLASRLNELQSIGEFQGERVDRAVCRFHQIVAAFRLCDRVPMESAQAVLQLVVGTSPQKIFFGQVIGSPLYETAMNHRIELMEDPGHLDLQFMVQHRRAEGRRHQVIELLLTIVRAQPLVCNPEHFGGLLVAYNCSTAQSDSALLELLQLYEANGHSAGLRAYAWGPGSAERRSRAAHTRDPANAVVASLDHDRFQWSVHHYCTAFRFGFEPVDATITAADAASPASDAADAALLNRLRFYDPLFLLPLLLMLLTDTPDLDLRVLVESNILSYIIMSLGVRDPGVRELGYRCLGTYRGLLDEARFRERLQVVAMLDSLKNAISEDCQHISPLICAFVSKAVLLAIHPGDVPMYTTVNKFVLRRFALDLEDVPLFYQLFNSSSQYYRVERLWILRLLALGVQDQTDVKIMRRRRVLDLVMHLYDSTVSDVKCRQMIVDLLEATIRLPGTVGVEMMTNRGILAWLQVLIQRQGAVAAGARGPTTDILRLLSACLTSTLAGLGSMQQSSVAIVASQLHTLVDGAMRLCEREWTAGGNRSSSIEFHMLLLRLVTQLCQLRANVDVSALSPVRLVPLLKAHVVLFHNNVDVNLQTAAALGCKPIPSAVQTAERDAAAEALRLLLRLTTQSEMCPLPLSTMVTVATFALAALADQIAMVPPVGDAAAAADQHPHPHEAETLSTAFHRQTRGWDGLAALVPRVVGWIIRQLGATNLTAADDGCNGLAGAVRRLRSALLRVPLRDSVGAVLECDRLLRCTAGGTAPGPLPTLVALELGAGTGLDQSLRGLLEAEQ